MNSSNSILLSVNDPSVSRVSIPDRQMREFDLICGASASLPSDGCGLVRAFDLALADGSVWRLETRLVETVPGLSSVDRRKPLLTFESHEEHQKEKALFWARWRGFTDVERAAFLRAVTPLGEARAA